MVVGTDPDHSHSFVFGSIAVLLVSMIALSVYAVYHDVRYRCAESRLIWVESQHCIIFSDTCLQWETRRHQVDKCVRYEERW